MRRRSLTVLGSAVCRWPRVFVLVGVALAVVAGVFTARRLEFKTSRDDLIGRDSEYWRFYSEYAREFGAEDDYLVVVESDQPARNRAVIDAQTIRLPVDSGRAAPIGQRPKWKLARALRAPPGAAARRAADAALDHGEAGVDRLERGADPA